MPRLTLIASLCLAGALVSGAYAQETSQQNEEPQPPPEQTLVNGRLFLAQDKPASGGAVYFVFQKRLNELPHEGTLDKVRAMSEVTVPVDQDGSFTLNMAPGNYAIVYDPNGTAPEDAKPGPESMAAQKRITPEQIKAKITAIQQNAAEGVPIKDHKIDGAYVVENRIVRPPVAEFGEMTLGDDHSVTIIAAGENGAAIDFPVNLRLRGKSGDVYEPRTPVKSDPARFLFEDVFPQQYQVFALGTKPRQGEGDQITTPTVTNNVFVFEGKPMEHKVTVQPGTPDNGESDQAPPAPPAAATSRKR